MKVIKLAAIGALSAAAAGCATAPAPEPFPNIAGMPISVVIDRIGLPEDDLHVAGETVYVWRREREIRRLRTGYGYGWPHHHRYGFGWPDEYRTVRCTLKLTVDARDRVTGWQRDGDARTCQRFADALAGPPQGQVSGRYGPPAGTVLPK